MLEIFKKSGRSWGFQGKQLERAESELLAFMCIQNKSQL